MQCFRRLTFALLPIVLTLLPGSSRAALISTYDLETLCFLSTDVVEASLVRHHQPGKFEYSDTFTATVQVPLEGRHQAGDQIKSLDLAGFDPARTGQRCILFLAPQKYLWPSSKNSPPWVVDMLLIDGHNQVHRYYQVEDPGGLEVDGLLPPHARFPSLDEECSTIKFKWNIAKTLKAPPYQEINRRSRSSKGDKSNVNCRYG